MADPSLSERKRKWLAAICLLLLMAGGGILRFRDIAERPMWHDEAAGTLLATLPFSVAENRFRHDYNTPFYIDVLHVWILVFDDSSPATMRSLSAAAGVLCIPALYLLLCRVSGRRVALGACFFLAASDYQVMISRDVKYFTLMELGAIGSIYFLVRFLDSGKRRWGAGVAGANALMILLHPYGFLFVLAQNVYFFLFVRRHRRSLGIWIAVNALSIVPYLAFWIRSLFGQLGNYGERSWIPLPLLTDPPNDLYRYLGFSQVSQFLLLLLAVWGLIRRGKNDAPVRLAWGGLFLCWALVPVAAAYLISIAWVPVYGHKYGAFVTPGLLAVIVFAVLQNARRWPQVVVALLLGLGLTVAWWPSGGPPEGWFRRGILYATDWEQSDREDWPDVITRIGGDGGGTAAKPVLLYPQWAVQPFLYYGPSPEHVYGANVRGAGDGAILQIGQLDRTSFYVGQYKPAAEFFAERKSMTGFWLVTYKEGSGWLAAYEADPAALPDPEDKAKEKEYEFRILMRELDRRFRRESVSDDLSLLRVYHFVRKDR